MEFAVGVIDIGMTNKKVAVYDSTLKQIESSYMSFSPKIVDGMEVHDLEAMEKWFCAQLKNYSGKYPIKALAVSAHGGTSVCLDKEGGLTVPCVYYTHEPGLEFHERFYEKFSSPDELQDKTGTPVFSALINGAKYLFLMKEKYPACFAKTHLILLYPQYWGWRFTGKAGIESTYLGCHSYLWDHVRKSFSSVAEDMGIAGLFPQNVQKPSGILGTITGEFADKTGLSRDTIVTLGIHDSNSSLLPYFAKKGETGFIVNSTGTWCVLMNPTGEYGFNPDEIGKTVLFNISAFGKPIKTSIFRGGQEFETWSQLIMDFHRRKDAAQYDEGLYRSIFTEKDAFLLPDLIPGSGQFPLSKARMIENGKEYLYAEIVNAVNNRDASGLPESFKNYEKAFALLEISLVIQTMTALERCGIRSGMEIFMEGGFCKDKAYNALLSAACPDNSICLSNIAEATALGAAMTAKMALTGKKLSDLAEDFEIEYTEAEKKNIGELQSYREAWIKHADPSLPQ